MRSVWNRKVYSVNGTNILWKRGKRNGDSPLFLGGKRGEPRREIKNEELKVKNAIKNKGFSGAL
jgi:hypothetical protein